MAPDADASRGGRASSPAPKKAAGEKDADKPTDSKTSQEKPKPRLYMWQLQVWLLFGSRATQTIMRMAMGPLLVYMCDELKCTAADKGSALSAFSLGYFSTQIIGGVLGDYAGARAIVSVSHVFAGIIMMLTPEAVQATGLSGLWFATVVLGTLQGPLFPASMSYLSKWLPAAERSWASTMLDSGITIGSLIVMPVSGWLAALMGWRTAFRVYGALSVVYSAAWHRYSSNDPADSAFVSKEELEVIKKGLPQKPAASNEPKESLLSASMGLLSRIQVWALFVSHAAFNFGVYFQNSWTAIYYKEALNISPESASVDFTLPHIANLVVKAGIAKPFFSWLLNKKGFSLLACRRLCTVVGFLGTAVAYVGLVMVRNMENARLLSTVFFSLGMALVGLHPSGFKANYMDLSIRSSGLISGLGNTFASVASFVGPLVVGQILSRYSSWPLVFTAVGAVNVSAAAMFGTLSSVTPVDAGADEADKKKQ